MYRAIKALFIINALLCLPVFTGQLLAQPIPPTPTAPIDGGIGIIITIGAAIGIRKLFKAKKR